LHSRFSGYSRPTSSTSSLPATRSTTRPHGPRKSRYLLIGTVFIAIAASVWTNRHIHVDLLYRLLPPRACRILSTLVDAIRAAFFGYAVYLTWAMMQKMGNYKMTIVDLPMNSVYAVCLVGFALGCLRSVQVLVIHWRQGYSILERPEVGMEGGI